jgi:hypothetical protein
MPDSATHCPCTRAASQYCTRVYGDARDCPSMKCETTKVQVLGGAGVAMTRDYLAKYCMRP